VKLWSFNMSSLSELFVPSETLMKWREPNAYVRKDLARGRWIILVIVFMIPCLLIFEPRHLFLGLFFTAFGLLAFVTIWFGSGDPVCLKEDHNTKSTGNSRKRSLYKNIESCNVCHDSYNSTKFSILKFSVRKGLPVGQIKDVGVPDDVNLDQILQFLRDKGVKVVEGELPSLTLPKKIKRAASESSPR
jgi:hypothetical protein